MKLHIDAARCQGHTMCKAVAPDLVDLSEEDGHATPRGNQITPELDAQARKAVLACPEGAVHLVDVE